MRANQRHWLRSAGLLLALAATAGWRVAAEGPDPVDVGARLELLVDRHLIDRLDGAALELHSPVPQEVVFRLDAPWEGSYCGYQSFVKDGDVFRTYYRGAQRLPNVRNKFEHMVTGVAESGDGIHWKRPALGLFEFQGSQDNNIIWRNEGTGGFQGYSSCFMVSLNDNPAARPEERYIAIAHSEQSGTTADGRPIGRHAIFTSPDGHRFTMKPAPVMERPQSDAGGDVVFWDTNLETYVAYLRAYWDAETRTIGGYKSKGVRSQIRLTSPDLEHWSEPEVVDYGAAPPENLYTMMPQQYFRAPHLYVGTPSRFMEQRKAVKEWWRDGVNDGVFVSSRDGLRWDRTFLEAFVRPGLDRDNWTSRSINVCRGIFQTGPTEMSVFWDEHCDHGRTEMHVRRGTLRLDGFASVSAPFAGGEMVTKPLVFAGGPLVLNYSTSAAGSIRVEIQDAGGTPIPGFTLDDSPERYGDEVAGAFAWQSGADLGALAGKAVRLRFVLHDADVYSLRFTTKAPAASASPSVEGANQITARPSR